MRPLVVRRALLVVAALVVALLASSGAAQAIEWRPFPVGSDPYNGGARYTGDFPDPSVIRVGSTYYAYSTTIANKNLPVLRSTNLVNWYAVRTPNQDDAQPLVPTWTDYTTIGSRRVAPTWAPSVIQFGGRYLHAYATRLKDRSRYCISVSRSRLPTGPFVDSSHAPLVCPTDQGAIDPYLWSDGDALYLLYKTEGIPGREPSRIIIGRVWSDASRFAPSVPRRVLLTTAPGTWEGSVIENPAMIRHLGHYYLFYSGNDWSSDRYAVGYATCSGPMGPCQRAGTGPLLHTSGNIAGPGGESPFIDAHGGFRLAYHAWTTGHVGYPATDACRRTHDCPQRRLRVARLAVDSDARLHVLSYVSW